MNKDIERSSDGDIVYEHQIRPRKIRANTLDLRYKQMNDGKKNHWSTVVVWMNFIELFNVNKFL